jgi:hypothetical protein
MLVVDCEMTGLEPDQHSIVSVGAVDLDHPERQLYEECRAWDGAKIEDEALAVNGFTREQITDLRRSKARPIWCTNSLRLAKIWPTRPLPGKTSLPTYYFLRAAAMRAGHTAWPFAHRIIDIHSLAGSTCLKGE